MKRQYYTPLFIEHGSIASLTGIFGGPSSGDVLLDTNGNQDGFGGNSIDACAEQNGKCICEDNSTC